MMKRIAIFLLISLLFVLGSTVYFLRKELSLSRESALFYERRNAQLQEELMRVSRLYGENKRFLDGLKENIEELERSVDLDSIERYLPKKIWHEVEPVVDRIKELKWYREDKGG
ncbi:MAG: hypothetical protein PHP89_01785 [Candidatus Omnitrophica bacterium]|jgi:hypothetical protein|nr:hypothetical protein [Candidatus Omnitrophota bacterium]MDD3987967.1 hypothetical protein [Candidatus Omnitrophota bacterium]MDD4982254.1 hypothetical protein [Candidatus Omnitrophota bacterium]